MNRAQARHLITRLSLAVVFIGIGIWEIFQPGYWSFYVPTLVSHFASPILVTMVQGTLLLIVGILVLIGAYLRITSIIAILMMLSVLIVLLTSFGITDIVIRDIAIFLIAVALYFDDTNYLRLTKG